MVDIVDNETRSRMMAGISSKNTKPELSLRSALHKRGFRFRIHDRRLLGKPDILLPRYRAVIFVHGCFWHRHRGCRFAYTPKTRSEFWIAKFKGNVNRDVRNRIELLTLGWRVATVWECALKKNNVDCTADQVAEWITGPLPSVEFPLRVPDTNKTRLIGF